MRENLSKAEKAEMDKLVKEKDKLAMQAMVLRMQEKDVVKKLSFVKSGLYKIELGSRGIWESIELVEDEVNLCVDGREVYDEECEEMYEDEEYENEFYGEIGYFDEGYMFGYNEEGVDYFVRVLVN